MNMHHAEPHNTITDCVLVPSSEHVAEIVGRKGCKIQSLRNKLNTYIRTPAKGEKPMFTIRGHVNDVARTRQEILSASEHFTVVMAARTSNRQVTHGLKICRLKVPYYIIGLIVGPKGYTIKKIQQLTGTYINTPSRHGDPVFMIQGTPDAVKAAYTVILALVEKKSGLITALRSHNPVTNTTTINDWLNNSSKTTIPKQNQLSPNADMDVNIWDKQPCSPIIWSNDIWSPTLHDFLTGPSLLRQ